MREEKTSHVHKKKRRFRPSHCAALKGNLLDLQRLADHQADLWIRNKRGDYPIHEAVSASVLDKTHSETLQQRKELVRDLLKRNPKQIECRNSEERTLLHLAASLGETEMCEVLIDCGARVNSFVRTNAVRFLRSILFHLSLFHCTFRDIISLRMI